MTTYVVGTAGHVDHGKSTLVKAMTGMDPDRLREEKERKLTIDLGFAWMTLAEDTQVGIVDVPGHRDFIENMLAGVGGIDAAILVIAADEGVMPQTHEHLEILDLLEIQRGVIALTKIDLIQEEDWLDLVEEEIREVLAGTVLAKAPIYRVSSLEGQGIEELKQGIANVLGESTPKDNLKRARIPIDRAFSLSGYGTIITGTLLDGRLQIGDEVHILPSGLEGRVRGLQTHKRDVELATPGSRVAVNVSGVDANNIERGDVLASDASDRPTQLIDAQVQVLVSTPSAIEHNQELKLFVGADQKIGRVRVLGGRQSIEPGESGYIQLMVREPLVVRRGDRFILRRPSPPLTMGGGRVVDPHPQRKHRLQDEAVVDRLSKMLDGSEAEVVLAVVDKLGPVAVPVIAERINMSAGDVEDILSGLKANGRVISLDSAGSSETMYLTASQFQGYLNQAVNLLQQHHERFPLRYGMPAEEVRSRLSVSQNAFQPLLDRMVASGQIARRGTLVHLEEFRPQLSAEARGSVESLLADFERAPYSPPSTKEAKQAVGEELYRYLVASGQLKEVSTEVAFRMVDYESMVAAVEELIKDQGKITVAELRDHLGTSRKYVLALLEHLDQIGVTVREGDYRRLA